MLTTDDNHEMRSYFVQPGIRIWRSVTLDFPTLYAFVNYASKTKRTWLYHTSILWQPDDVLDFCGNFKDDKTEKIIDIWLLEPLFKGDIHTWRWTTVLEIKKYFEEPGPAIPVYFTDAGESVGLTAEESKRDMEVIYTRRDDSNK